MISLYTIPLWFLNYTIILGLVFTIITLLVGLYSIKIYKLSMQKQSKIFGVGFLFIAFSYFIKTLMLLIPFSKLHIERIIDVSTFSAWTSLGAYLHILFFLTGLITILYATLNVNNFRLFSLILALTIIPLTLSTLKLQAFHILASILLIYITGHYLMCYLSYGTKKNILVFLAFLSLLFVNIDLIFSQHSGIYYVLGDLLSFIAYGLILIKLILITKK
ncbi:hypothetical protein J4216_01980 [Candidatus Woesearchaeota archaeon]|nr:hypothetical protein [Candidatus Woesearchaeota archaeon]